MLMPIAASAQYISVVNTWSADKKKLTVTISNTSDQPMLIYNNMMEEQGCSYLHLHFQKSNGTELGNYFFIYRLKPSDKIKRMLIIPPNSSIKCEDYDVLFFANIAVANTNEIKKIQLSKQIKYEIPALNYKNVYRSIGEVTISGFDRLY